MRKKFVFATNNSHKLEEVTAILGEKVELLSMKDIKCDTDIPETAMVTVSAIAITRLLCTVRVRISSPPFNILIG